MTELDLAHHLRRARGPNRIVADASFELIAEVAAPAIESWVTELAPPQSREDFRQVALLALSQAVRSFNRPKPSAFWAWCRVVVRRRLIEALRDHQRQKRDRDIVASDGRRIGDGEDHTPHLIAAEDAGKKRAVLGRLMSETEREVFTLFVGGKTYSEIGRVLGFTRKSVGNALQRARVKAKRYLMNGQTIFHPRTIQRFAKQRTRI